ncbi:MAG: beta-lactamase family protein [Deltaproteobacteria bacterium]|nr:beta-lactamase family protein [Nannocystaceae bacterium]
MRPWANEDTPGCAVAVIQEREVVHAKGYGMADLQHGIPITPDTVFDIGSVSKQFTASAILLAAAEGRLSLDDDIRAHVPSLPQLGATPTTIRHLVHHTGGLRDFGTLLLLAGHHLDDTTTVRDALELLARQRGRDFEPGTKYQYSNTGYFLLAQVVEHATKQPLRAYVDAKIFAPLGMTRTRIHDDLKEIIPGRAIGYARRGVGWEIGMWRWAQTGNGAVLTTVLDLAKWDANFYAPKVGGQPFLDALHARGKLLDGTELAYAAGLIHGSYRGEPTVVHPGGGGGYVAQVERFPRLETTIAVLCNADGARPDLLAHRIADIVLEQRLHADPVPDAVPPTIQLTAAQLDAWTGTYREAVTGELVTIGRTGHALELRVGGERIGLDSTNDRTFLLRHQWHVAHLEGAAPRRKLVLRSPMGEETFAEAELHRPTARELAALVGRYRSDELGTEWTLSISGDDLVATGPAFDGPAVLVPATNDEFTIMALDVGVVLRVTRDRRRRVTGVLLGSGSMQGLHFARVR